MPGTRVQTCRRIKVKLATPDCGSWGDTSVQGADWPILPELLVELFWDI